MVGLLLDGVKMMLVSVAAITLSLIAGEAHHQYYSPSGSFMGLVESVIGGGKIVAREVAEAFTSIDKNATAAAVGNVFAAQPEPNMVGQAAENSSLLNELTGAADASTEGQKVSRALHFMTRFVVPTTFIVGTLIGGIYYLLPASINK